MPGSFPGVWKAATPPNTSARTGSASQSLSTRKSRHPKRVRMETVQAQSSSNAATPVHPVRKATRKKTLFKSFFLGGFECSTHRTTGGKRLDLIASTAHDRLVR